MPKLKTKSSAKKRFRLTAKGKVKMPQANKRLGMIKRTNSQIRKQRGTTIRVARHALQKAMKYSYRDIKAKKIEFRSLCIQRINAGVRDEGMTYSRFINGLAKSKIKLDRKVLAELAYNNPEVFKTIVKKVQSSLN